MLTAGVGAAVGDGSGDALRGEELPDAFSTGAGWLGGGGNCAGTLRGEGGLVACGGGGCGVGMRAVVAEEAAEARGEEGMGGVVLNTPELDAPRTGAGGTEEVATGVARADVESGAGRGEFAGEAVVPDEEEGSGAVGTAKEGERGVAENAPGRGECARRTESTRGSGSSGVAKSRSGGGSGTGGTSLGKSTLSRSSSLRSISMSASTRMSSSVSGCSILPPRRMRKPSLQ